MDLKEDLGGLLVSNQPFEGKKVLLGNAYLTHKTIYLIVFYPFTSLLRLLGETSHI